MSCTGWPGSLLSQIHSSLHGLHRLTWVITFTDPLIPAWIAQADLGHYFHRSIHPCMDCTGRPGSLLSQIHSSLHGLHRLAWVITFTDPFILAWIAQADLGHYFSSSLHGLHRLAWVITFTDPFILAWIAQADLGHYSHRSVHLLLCNSKLNNPEEEGF